MIDETQIYKWCDIFGKSGSLVEVRVIDSKGKIYSGYFKSVDAIINAIRPYDRMHVQIYFTLNEINDGCYSRVQHDKIIPVSSKEPTTGDNDIDRRKFVLIDLDPKRPAGVSSTNAELELAHRLAVVVYRFLITQGFSEPIICKSGNGYHIVIPCDMKSDDESKDVVCKFLKAISMIFTDDKVDIDEKVYNASRICKLYGVTAKKGENTVERPWRQSEIIKVPIEIKPTDIAYFKKVAAMYPEEEKPNRYNNYSTERFDLTNFLNSHGIGYKTERVAGGTKYILDHCPFNDQHKHKDAVIFQRDGGAIGFICLHNSCSNKTWRDVRLLFEPNAYDRQYRQNTQPYKQDFTIPQPIPILKTQEKGEIWLKMSGIDKPRININDFIPSGIPAIDERGLGFKRGFVSVWTGFRGCGKSSLLNMLILNAAQKGFKSALWTGELTSDMAKQWLYLQAAGKQYTKRYGETDYYYVPDFVSERIDPWMDKYVWLFNNKYGDNFLQIKEQIEKLKKEQGIDSVFLDNLMVLNIRELEKEKYDRQAVLLQQLEDLAKELNVHIHLVAHPHKSFGYLRVDNISGSGDISNKADNIFIVSRINRDFQNNAKEVIDKVTFQEIIASGCTNVIEIAKFRSKGSLADSFAKLWFELESNRLKNYLSENVNYNWNPDPIMSDMPFAADVEECPF